MMRIQLEMPDERVAELDALISDLGLSTRKELFNNALTLLEWAVREKRAGRSIASVDQAENKIREILMPALEHVLAVAAGPA